MAASPTLSPDPWFSAAGEEDPGSALDAPPGLETPAQKASPMSTTIADIMTPDVQTVGPEETLQRAAQLMDQLGVGSLPVSNGQQLLGMITDRDITVRGTAANLRPDETCVSDVMTQSVQCCTDDQDPQQALGMMGDAQVRRLPVVDAGGKLVGIVSIGDLATRQPGSVDETVRAISEPSEPDGGAQNS
jgi:CBS domain-containing protein